MNRGGRYYVRDGKRVHESDVAEPVTRKKASKKKAAKKKATRKPDPEPDSGSETTQSEDSES